MEPTAHSLQPGALVAGPAGSAAAGPVPVSPRLTSLDAYRGVVMFLMMAEVLNFAAVSAAAHGSGLWRFLARQQAHVEWTGCTLHDLIHPSFSFLVGLALPFSLAARLARNQSRWRMTAHAFWRALVLVLLGVFLCSVGRAQTNWSFEDALSQIGLGYGLLFLLGLRPARDQWMAVAVILAGYWTAFALYPLPARDFDYAQVGVPANWPHLLSGFAAHWNKNSNLAWAFDTWFLNLFPRETPFLFHSGGYVTLSFIPTLAIMTLGLLAGNWLRGERSPSTKVKGLAAAGVIGLASGWTLGALGICPVIKRVWTPSWVLVSGGWCLLFLGGFYLVIEVWACKRWTFPLVVIGMNSIAAYCLALLAGGFVFKSLAVHLGAAAFKILGAAYAPLLHGAAVLLVLWLALFWMYRRKIFLRI